MAARRDDTQTGSRGQLLDRINALLERCAHRVTLWVGGNWAFATACAVVLAWVATGPIFHYSDTWQLVINTSTTIITFLMVFLIQRAQNKESRAMQLKLNELVAAVEGASNRLICAEDMNEGELETLARHYQVLGEMVKRDIKLTSSHSIEEAERRHSEKQGNLRTSRAAKGRS